MSKAIPQISKYMTAFPHTVGSDQPIAKAQKMMAEYRVRHLPVLRGGKLIGVITERDVQLVETFKDVNPETLSVEEAYTPDPYITSPESPIDEVCAEMANHKYGCVLVVDNKKLVGIFTWVDALRAMGELFKTRLK